VVVGRQPPSGATSLASRGGAVTWSSGDDPLSGAAASLLRAAVQGRGRRATTPLAAATSALRGGAETESSGDNPLLAAAASLLRVVVRRRGRRAASSFTAAASLVRAAVQRRDRRAATPFLAAATSVLRPVVQRRSSAGDTHPCRRLRLCFGARCGDGVRHGTDPLLPAAASVLRPAREDVVRSVTVPSPSATSLLHAPVQRRGPASASSLCRRLRLCFGPRCRDGVRQGTDPFAGRYVAASAGARRRNPVTVPSPATTSLLLCFAWRCGDVVWPVQFPLPAATSLLRAAGQRRSRSRQFRSPAGYVCASGGGAET
jgi:hypothetical protein